MTIAHKRHNPFRLILPVQFPQLYCHCLVPRVNAKTLYILRYPGSKLMFPIQCLAAERPGIFFRKTISPVKIENQLQSPLRLPDFV